MADISRVDKKACTGCGACYNKCPVGAITMKLDNDSLDFYNNGTRVAYMSDNTLYITDGRFTRSVRIGNYGFIPEQNGSVSFTYLGGES